MRKVIFILFIAFGMNGLAQQLTQLTQYMANQYLLNPGVAGAAEDFQVKGAFRKQWVGLEDSPTTFYASFTGFSGTHVGLERGRIRNEHNYHHGFGALVLVDKTGPTSQTNILGTYAYHLNASKHFNISVAASVGLKQFSIDVSDLDIAEKGYGNVSESKIDGNLGVWVYNERFYGGISAMQVFNNKIDLSSTNTLRGNLSRHYYATLGYRFSVSEEFEVVPSFLVKYVSPAPPAYDLNVKAIVARIFWGGISYRVNDAVAAIVGMRLDSGLDVSYSYDMTTSALGNYNSGSHEITLGFRFNPKGDLWSPQDFW